MNKLYNKSKSRQDFDKARNKAFIRDFINKILNKNNDLFQFDEVKYLLSPYGMVHRGFQTIPINRIVGSEGRYQDFDRDFLPVTDSLRSRWENISLANLRNIELPPISAYKINDFYFVRDGNHRVSVAKELGQEFIDAEVVELFTKIKLEEISEKGLLLAESQKYFLDKTGFDEIIPGASIKLTNPWGYYRLIEHIKNYQYFLGLSEKRNISWEEAVKKWYNELYLKLIRLIKKRKILTKFPEREAGDLYIWVMDHWHFLKEKYGNIPIENALDDYSLRFGKGKTALFFYNLKNRVKSWLLKR